jgi:hypothetical protein
MTEARGRATLSPSCAFALILGLASLQDVTHAEVFDFHIVVHAVV